MNLRILKKLSKRAVPLLLQLGYEGEVFAAEGGENHCSLANCDRKHWARHRSIHADLLGEHHIKYPAKDGKGWVSMWPPTEPRKGTMMTGGVSGYYEPEWSEEPAWDMLVAMVFDHFTIYSDTGDDCTVTRELRTPSQIFAAAAAMVADR